MADRSYSITTTRIIRQPTRFAEHPPKQPCVLPSENGWFPNSATPATWGGELSKAETALRLDLDYEQDKPIRRR